MKVGEMMAPRDAFGDALVELGAINSDVVVFDSDVGESTQSSRFGKYEESASLARLSSSAISRMIAVWFVAGGAAHAPIHRPWQAIGRKQFWRAACSALR